MAKGKELPETTAHKPEEGSQKAATSPRWRYVGPMYSKGLILKGEGRITPHVWTHDQIEAFLAEHPEKASWFVKK